MLNEEHLIEKRNNFNEMRANNMSLQETRLLIIYLSKINSRAKESTRLVRFSLDDFGKIMELKRVQAKDLRPVVGRLLRKIVYIYNKSGGYDAFQLFKKCRVDVDDCGVWYIEIDSHDDAIPLMFDFKDNYFKYKLGNVIRLSSTNKVRMYELIKQYEHSKEKTIPLNLLRDWLGIDKSAYTQWQDFKRCVIIPCQKALEELTDVKFTYTPKRKGRGGKITAIQFHISSNKKFKDSLSLEEFIELEPTQPEIINVTSRVRNNATEPPRLVDYSSNDKKPRYSTEEMKLLASACKNEFDEHEMNVLFSLICLMPIPDTPDGIWISRYHYLLQKYAILVNAAHKIGVTNRFRYILKLVEDDYLRTVSMKQQ